MADPVHGATRWAWSPRARALSSTTPKMYLELKIRKQMRFEFGLNF
jgi:hypothetical protein